MADPVPVVRRATRDDCAAILAIYNDAVLKTTASYDLEPRTLEHRLQWFDAHAAQGLPVFVAVLDGRVVAWSSLSRFHDRYGYRFTCENSIYVEEAHRGRGLGGLLLAPLIDAARDLGLHTIIAVIDASNEASVRLHTRHGFVECGRFKEVGHKFNRWLDVVYLQRMI